MINQLQEKYQLSMLWLLSSVAVMGVFPFVIIRYQAGNLLAAGIDITLIIGMIVLVAYTHYSKKIRVVSAIIAVFINVGAVVIAIANGLDSFLWVYPVFASTFILVKPFEAFCMNIIAGAALVSLSDIFDLVAFDSVVVTLLMLSMSAFVYANHSAKQFELLETLNCVDPLTGAFNRRAMNTDITTALSNANQNGTKQSLAILDLDYFKKVNDEYGHGAGDKILQDFVTITTSHIRKSDRLYRFGGEEFVLLIPDMQDQHSYINQLRNTIKNQLTTPDGKAITVSLGIAPWIPNTTADTWLQRADEALYIAKEKGRDCAVFSSERVA